MSQDPNPPGGQPNDGSADPAGDKDVVAYTTYKKTVGEVKSLKAKLAELEAEKEVERQQRLQQEGKWKEAAEEWQKKAKDHETKSQDLLKSFGRKVFTSEAKAIAAELGANPDALDDIIKVGDWSEVEIGEDFQVDREKLKAAVTKMQQAKPFYFKQQVNPPKTVNPGNGGAGSGGSKSLESMSVDELIKVARENYK